MGTLLKKRKIDIVVPIRNEQTSIPLFIHAVNSLAIPESVLIRIIFVEDGSTDNTLQTLRDIAASIGNVSYYTLETGFGEVGAVAFGMSRSIADAVITMETSGGHPVELIPEMISHYLAGAEIVQAIRLSLKNRKLYRTVGTSIFNILLRLLTGFEVNRQNVYFRLLTRKQKDILIRDRRFLASLRFILSDANVCGVDQVYFHANDRISGASKYNFVRLAGFSLDFVLAMISVTRLCFLLIFLLFLGLLMAFYLSPWSAIVVVICVIGIAIRSWKLWNNKILENIIVTEQHISD